MMWQEGALCAQTDPEIFFPEVGVNPVDAKKVCGRCDVRTQCLQDALTRDDRGIWGGLSRMERRQIKSCGGAVMSRQTITDPGTCQTCHKPMRRQRTKVADYPGTTIRSAEGLCTNCRRRKGPRPGRQPLGPPDPLNTAWRIAFEEDRKARGIPPEGLLQ